MRARSSSSSTLVDQSGFSLVQVLVVIGISAFVIHGIVGLVLMQNKVQKNLNMKTSALAIRQSLIGSLSNHGAWAQTRTNDPTLVCTSPIQAYCDPASVATKPIALYDASGTIVFDSTSPTNGMTINGQLCNSFSAAGNDACPFRPEVLWRAACPAPPCSNQEDHVTIVFKYSPSPTSSQLAFNSGLYGLPEQLRTKLGSNDSPLLHCARLGSVFVGYSQTFNGVASDSQGCVPYSAFIGPQGPPGPPGPQGPTGPPGPQGVAAVCP